MRYYWYTIMPFCNRTHDPMVWNSHIRPVKTGHLENGTCHARPVKDTRSFPPGHVFDSKTASLALCFGETGVRTWGSPLVQPIASCFFGCFCDVLCGLDSARTSNITGMYWGPNGTSGWSAGQPSMAKPSNHRGGPKFGDNPSCGSWFSTHQ